MNSDIAVECTDFNVWGRTIDQQFGLHTMSRPQHRFRASLFSARFGELTLTELYTQPALHITRTGHGSSHHDQLFLFLIRQGSALQLHSRQLSRADNPVLTLVDAATVYSSRQSADFRSLVVTVPRHCLYRRSLPLRGNSSVSLDAGTGLPSLAADFIDGIWRERDHLDSADRTMLQQQLLHWLELLLNDHSRSEEPRDSRLKLILGYLDAHIHDPDLNADRAGRALGISPRYVHALMRAGGWSVGRYLLEQRLRHSRRCLADHDWRHRSITDIALHWGFNDMSHYSRSFKSRFGEGPRSYRQRMQS